MAIYKLQDKIRKMKNPTILNFSVLPEYIPQQILENSDSFLVARERYCIALMDALKEIVPGVRFSYPTFALAGADGLDSLKKLLDYANECGYYVLLDGVTALSAQEAAYQAELIMGVSFAYYYDGLIITDYIGSDVIKPYLPYMKENGKDLFVVARTANRSAGELQDLLSGTRWMHFANVDMINRFVTPLMTKCAYSQVAVVASASHPDSLRNIRQRFKEVFLLMDGCDYPNANAKNCSNGFDQIGHGAAACACSSILAAWQEEDGQDYVSAAIAGAQRVRKNLLRYVTIL